MINVYLIACYTPHMDTFIGHMKPDTKQNQLQRNFEILDATRFWRDVTTLTLLQNTGN